MVAPNDGQLQNFPLVPVRAYQRVIVTDSSQAFNATLVLYGVSVRSLLLVFSPPNNHICH
jgi:hypothetical protein